MVPMDSGQSRAASLMHAARRSHFVSRIEKYEAKLRQARAVTREQRLAMATSAGERQHLRKEEDNSYLSEKVVEPEQLVIEQKAIKQQEVIKKQDELGLLEHNTMIEKKEIGPGTQELQRTMSAVMKDVLKHTEALNITCHMPENKVCTENPKPLTSQANLYMEFLKPSANPEVNIAAVAASLKVRIKAADMAAPMQEHAFRHARECLTTLEKLHCKRIAYSLKKEFDKVYGPAWHCIVGTSFGSYVTHSLGGFAYFSLDKISVLLFKTTVEPLEH